MSRDMTPEKGNFIFVFILALVVVITFAFFVYRQPLAPRIDTLTHSVGELERDIGNNMRLAGDVVEAIAQYEFALEHTRFEGPQNRTEVEERLGTLLVEAGRYGEALPHFVSAVQEPHPRIGAFRPWVLALEGLGRFEAVAGVIEAWEVAALAEENVTAQVDMLEARARMAKRKGDMAGYGAYLAEAAGLLPGSAAGALWGRYLVDEGKYTEAAAVFDAWLWAGGLLYGGEVPQDDDGRLAATLAAWETALAGSTRKAE